MDRQSAIDLRHEASYPLHGRVQIALPERRIATGRTLSVSAIELCAVLDERLPVGASYMIRFEIFANGKLHLVTAPAKAVYGVFASRGGFRVGLHFADDDEQRTALILSLAGRKVGANVARPTAPAARPSAAEVPVPTHAASEVEVAAN